MALRLSPRALQRFRLGAHNVQTISGATVSLRREQAPRVKVLEGEELGSNLLHAAKRDGK